MSRTLLPRALGLLAALAGLSLGACELQPPPGSFSLAFHWDTPPEATVFLWARVEHRPDDPLAPGDALALAGPVKLEPGGSADLALTDVPNGDDRVVVVEVRAGDQTTLPVQYFGFSEPFAIEPGKNTSVDVSLAFQEPAEEIANQAIELLFGDPPAPRDEVVEAEAGAAVVRVSASGGVKALLANDPSFLAGFGEVAFDGSTPGTSCESSEAPALREGAAPVTVVTCTLPAWNLLDGLPQNADGHHDDGLYGVFAKVVDRYGYESEVFEATVELDASGPEAIRSTLSTPLAKPGDPVVVSVISSEVLDPSATSLAGEPLGGETSPLAFGPAQQLGGKATSTSYTFTAKVPADAAESSWRLVATFTDPLGNTTEGAVLRDDPAEGGTLGPELVVTVDATPPALVLDPEPALSKDVFALADDGATLTFDFALVEAHPAESLPEVRVDGKAIGVVTPLPSLDDPAASQHGFRFETPIEISAWPGVDLLAPVEVSWIDAAGHKATAELPSRPHLDFRPPSASCKLTPEGRPAGLGEPVQLLVTADEPLAPEFPSVASGGAIWVSPQEGSLTTVHIAGPFDPGTEIASLPVEVTLADAAGNLAADVCPGLSFSVDTVPPAVLDAEVGPLLVKAGETVSIAFATPPDVVGTPEVRVGELTAEPLGGPEPAWTYALVVPEDATSGLRAIRVTLADAAGNLVVDESLPPVAIDVDPPQLTCTSSVAEGAAVGLGQAVVVVVQSDEALAGGVPLPAGVTGLAFAPPDSKGLSTTFVALVGAPDVEASFSWAFTATDLVGNALDAPGCSGAGTIDTVFPEVVAATKPAATLLGPGGEVDLAFSVSEPLPQAPSVFVGGGPAAAVDAEGPDFVFRFTAAEGVPEGVHAVQIGLVDGAKNQAFDTTSFPALTVDLSEPGLALLTVSPELAGAGGTLTAVLVASEPLAGPPPLLAKTTGGATLEFAPLTSGKGAASYTYALALSGGVADGEYAFDSVALEDLAGNAAAAASTATFTVDATPPVVSGLAVSPDRVGKSGTLVASFEVSEPVESAGVLVDVGGRPAACAGGGTAWTCTYEVAGDEVAPGTEAALIVVARVADAAGNQGTASGTVVFDLLPPSLTCLASHGPSKPAKLGDVVTLTLTSTEALAAPGLPVVTSNAPLSPEAKGLITTFTVPILAQWGETTWTFAVGATDLVGNVADPACEIAPIPVDGVLPGVVDGSVSIAPAFLASGAATTIAFTATEPLLVPGVRVGPYGATPVDLDGPAYEYTWTADPAFSPDGVQSVTVTLPDVAGNVADVVLGNVTVDTTPPSIVVADVTPSAAKLGDTLTFLLSTDEALSQLPIVVAQPAAGGDPLVFAYADGNPGSAKIRYEATVTEALPSGVWTFDPVTLFDLAGNSEEAAISATLTLDSTLPAIGPLTVSPERIDEFGLLTVAFEVDEPVPSEGVHVSVGAIQMGCTSPDGLAWSCAYEMLGTEIPTGEEAAKTVLAVVSDAAGNETSGSATVVFDFRDPGFTCTASHGPESPAGDGAVVSVTVTADETLQPGSLAVTSDAPNVTSKSGGLSTTYSALVGPLLQTTWTFAFSATDLAGNHVESACPSLAPIPIDSVPPTLLEGSTVAPAAVDADDLATFTFTVSEDVAAPKVLVGTAQASYSFQDGPAYTFSWTAGPEAGDGPKGVTVRLVDLAGNASELQIGTVVVDTTAPSIVVASASPAVAKLGDTISLLVSTDEAVAEAPEVLARHSDGSTTLPFTLVQGGPGSLQFTYVAAVTSDFEGGDYTFDAVELVDALGNSRTTALPAGFGGDAVVPEVKGFLAAPARTDESGSLEVTFKVSEPVQPEGVSVKLAGSLELPCTNDYETHWVCTHDVLGTEAAPGLEETVTFLGVVSDAAGNQGSASTTVVFDFKDPVLTCTASHGPGNPAGLGDVVQVTVTADETLEPGTLEVATNAPGVTSKAAGLSTTFSATVPNVVTSWSFTFTARDLAGNEVTGACAEMEAIPVDGDAPSLESSSFSPASVAAGDVATISFSTSEEVSTPRVTVGGALADLASHDGDAWVFTFTPNAGSQNGDRTVTIELTDLAGNESEKSIGDLVVDTKPPSFVVSSVTPKAAKLDDEVTLLLSTNEGMAVVPDVTARHEGGTTTLPFTLSDGAAGDLQLVFEAPIAAGLAEGTWSFDAVTLVDALGNTIAVVPPATFTADASVPVVSNLTLQPARAGLDDTLDLSFTSSEPLSASGIEVEVAGYEMACAGTEAGTGWTCTHAVQGDETDLGTSSTKPVFVTATDAAGNAGTESVTMTFDFQAPSVLVASRTYGPADSNPLTKVTSATIGTEVEVRVTASEPLLEDLVLTTLEAVPEPGGTPFELVTADVFGSLAVFTYTVPSISPPADGAYALRVTWADPYGNVVDSLDTATTLVVDKAAGTLTIDQDEVVFLRSPWGNAMSETFPSGLVIPGGAAFALTGPDPFSNAAIAPGTFLLGGGESPTKIRVFAEQAKVTSLGTITPVEGGCARTVLPGIDTAAIWITGVDGAGNESAPVKVKQVEWVATPNTSKFVAVHDLLGTDDAQDVVRGPKGHEQTDVVRAGAAGLFNNLTFVSRKIYWRDVPTSLVEAVPDQQLRGFASAWDSARGVLVLYGGSVGSTYRNHVLEYDGDRWTKVLPATVTEPGGNQAKGFRASMTYDEARGRVFLFGGEYEVQKKTTDFSTYEWDGTQWTYKSSPKPVPSKRISTAMAWDGKRGRVVLVGGGLEVSSWSLGTAALLGDAWAWNGASWTALPAGPSARLDAAMAWDAARDRLVLFGGATNVAFPGAITAVSGETWEFDGTSWALVSPDGGSPPARSGAAMAYDPVTEKVFLHGGSTNNVDGFSDLWSWDGTAWVEESADVPGVPFVEGRGIMHWDSMRKELLLLRRCTSLDGCSQDAFRTALFTWDGSEFHTRNVATDRDFGTASEFGMVWDEDRDRLVSFGDTGGHHGGLGSDSIREFDRDGWSDFSPTVRPPERGNHAMVWDPGTGVTWIYGGASEDVVLEDLWRSSSFGPASSWTEVDPAAPPGARRDATLVHDPDGGRLLLFGGYDKDGAGKNDLWAFDTETETWTVELTSGGPPPVRGEHGAVWDPIRHVLVVWGGKACAADVSECAIRGDLWEYVDGTWEQTILQAGPPPLYSVRMVFDPVTERAVVIGGVNAAGNPTGTFDGWNGTNWGGVDNCMNGCSPAGLTARYRHVALSAQDRLFVYGGVGVDGKIGDMEERVLTNPMSPAATFIAGLTPSGIDPATVQDISVRSRCTASSGSGSDAVDLAVWEAWGEGLSHGRWTVVDDLPVYSGSALLEWSASSPEEAARFVRTRDAEIAIQCRPTLPTYGTDPNKPTVTLDYFEVRLRLMLP